MEKNKPEFKKELSKLLAKNGRWRKWLIEQLEIAPTTFERAVREDTFSNEEKDRIKNLIINGK